MKKIAFVIRECPESEPEMDWIVKNAPFDTNVLVVPRPSHPDLKHFNPDLMIGRYCTFPFYDEWYKSCLDNGAWCIHTPEQWGNVAIGYRTQYLIQKDLSTSDKFPLIPTWKNLNFVPKDHDGYVLKGMIKGCKGRFKDECLVKRWVDLPQKINAALSTSWGEEGVYVRPFIKLKTVGDPFIGGLPLSAEFRFHFCNGKLVASHFLWEDLMDNTELQVITSSKTFNPFFLSAEQLAHRANLLLSPHARFYAIDVAIQDNGLNSPIVVEVNEGQSAGVSESAIGDFYRGVVDAVRSSNP